MAKNAATANASPSATLSPAEFGGNAAGISSAFFWSSDDDFLGDGRIETIA
jgi:hypothetical protein